MTNNVLPFLADPKSHLPDGQFSFASQIHAKDHAVVGVSFRIGDGAATTISTALGNVIVTHAEVRCYSPKAAKFPPHPPSTVEPDISNSGDLTREKIGKLIAMMILDAQADGAVGKTMGWARFLDGPVKRDADAAARADWD